jgi:uncharacterized integral membrane protein
MSLRSILVIVVIAALALFAAVNWSTFTTPTSLSLVVTNIEAPLGMVMLGFTGVLIAVLLGFALQVKLNALSDSRRQASELRDQRELADQAEASRFTDLRNYIEREFGSLRQAQLDSVERLRDELAATTNALSACIGEIDDRLERQWPTPLEKQP